MMRRIILAVVCLFALSTPVFAQNLLSNPNFETVPTPLNTWIFGPFSQQTNNPAKVIEGNVSGCTQLSVFPQEFYSSTRQTINVSTAQNYWFRVDARPQFSNEAKEVRVGLEIIGRNVNNLQIFQRKKEIGATLPVMTLDVDNVQFPAGTVTAEFNIFAYASHNASITYQQQEFCFDRAVATTTALPPLPKATALFNNDFEYNTVFWEEEGNPGFMINVPFSGTWSLVQELIPFTTNTPSFNRASQIVYCNANGSPCAPGQRISAGHAAITLMDQDKVMEAGLMMQFVNASGQIIRDGNNNEITITDPLSGVNQYRFLFVSTDTLSPAGVPPGTVGAKVGPYQFAPKATVQAAGLRYSAADFVLTGIGIYPRSLIFPILNTPFGENWSFENSLNRWTRCCQPVGLNQSVVHGGNQSASIQVTSLPATNFFGEAAQRVVAIPGRTAHLNAWVNTQALGAPQGNASISIAAFDANGFQLGLQTQPLPAGFNWTLVNVSLPVAANATELKVSVSTFIPVAQAQVGQVVYFDDLSFIQQ